MDGSTFAKIEKLTQGLVGRIGVAAQEIGSGRSLEINSDEKFVMASTFKMAVAVALLDLVDKGKIQLTDMIDIPQDLMTDGPNPIVMNFFHGGCKLSIRQLDRAHDHRE